MIRRIDLVAKTFGRLLVLGRDIPLKKRGMWKCICKCGKLVIASTSNLKRGKVKSCGCLKSEISTQSIKKIIGYNTLEKGQAVLNKLYGDYKSSARSKNLDFKLTKSDFERYTKQVCFYCNREPYHAYYDKKLNGSYIGNGLDRLNCNMGYVYSNIVPCCKICNIMKNVLTPKEFIEHIIVISQNISNIKEKLCL